MLGSAGDRSATAYLSVAKLWHLFMGYSWATQFGLAARDTARSALRGVGLANKSSALPFKRLHELPDDVAPWTSSGPLGPRRALLVGSWWLLREIELANILIGNVHQVSPQEVLLHLPASKSDPTGRGAHRAHRCACGRCPGAAAFL